MSYSQVILSRLLLCLEQKDFPISSQTALFLSDLGMFCVVCQYYGMSGVLGVTAEERVALTLSSGFNSQKRAVLCSESGGLIISSEDSRTGCPWL